MIKGKAKLEFGTGDIRMTACLSNDIGTLCMITQEPHEIGSKVPVEDTWSAEESQVIMTFTKIESIDALMETLQEAKDFMNGKFPEGMRTNLCNHEINLDAFMDN